MKDIRWHIHQKIMENIKNFSCLDGHPALSHGSDVLMYLRVWSIRNTVINCLITNNKLIII